MYHFFRSSSFSSSSFSFLFSALPQTTRIARTTSQISYLNWIQIARTKFKTMSWSTVMKKGLPKRTRLRIMSQSTMTEKGLLVRMNQKMMMEFSDCPCSVSTIFCFLPVAIFSGICFLNLIHFPPTFNPYLCNVQ